MAVVVSVSENRSPSPPAPAPTVTAIPEVPGLLWLVLALELTLSLESPRLGTLPPPVPLATARAIAKAASDKPDPPVSDESIVSAVSGRDIGPVR